VRERVSAQILIEFVTEREARTHDDVGVESLTARQIASSCNFGQFFVSLLGDEGRNH
jgi:hypothetical protein